MSQPYSRSFSTLLSSILLFTLTGALATSCGSKGASSTVAMEQATAAIAESETIANRKAVPETVQTSSQAVRNSLANGVSRVASPAQLTRPAQLSRARLDLIDAELGRSEALIRNQSFAVNLSGLGIVDFVPSKVQEDSGKISLALRWRDINGNYVPLFLSDQWQFYELSAVGFEDVNGDGLGPDVVAIAQYITGIGPEGAKPFPRATVLFNDGNDQFNIDPAVENRLAEGSAATVEDVRTLLASPMPTVANQAPAEFIALKDLTAGTYARLKVKRQFCVGDGCEPSQRQYALKDAQLKSSSGERQLNVELVPDVPIAKEDAIAYGQILSGQANVIFINPITEKTGNVTTGETYFSPKPEGRSVPHTAYSVRFNMTEEGTVDKITFSSAVL